uniref:Putative homing endonuclease n=1 Tax=viral metagenome TaxID=1070528 RepID=A0A6M3IY92_9ZZZZ
MQEYEIGTIKLGREIGYKGGTGRNKHIFAACVVCGKPRWVQLIGGGNRNQRCRGCVAREFQKTMRGSKNPNFKHAYIVNRSGYKMVRVYPEDPFYCMRTMNNYVLEHRIIMARHLNRALMSNEQVHHINNNKLDNSISNLEVVSPREHSKNHMICHDCPLKKELRLLRWEMKELREQLKFKLELF